ncbi:MAG: hypothetical protein M1830_009676 [Pleopsidium flavum]|nr:MAG: hypothetical protein M1830_009676 [Pleopsidium flavum]
MAPIEPDTSNCNLRPLLLLSGYLFTATALTTLIIRNVLYRAHRSLPPSQTTRHRQSNRRKHVQIFASLSVLSLAITSYYLYSSLSLSYRVWAHERGEALPCGLWRRGGVFGSGDEGVALELGRWMNDTTLVWDNWEIIVERSRRFWWSQQIFLGTTVWSVFVGIEGRRRNIPYLWAYMALGEMVAAAFGQNLFFLTILMTPVPLADSDDAPHQTTRTRGNARSGAIVKAGNAVKDSTITTEHAIHNSWRKLFSLLDRYIPSKPATWTPHSAVYILPLIINYVAIFLVPFASNTPSFSTVVLIPHLLLYLPLYIDRLIPHSFGSTHNTPHDARRAYKPIFKFISIISFLLHLKQTLVALLDNEPGSHYHRHSSLFSHQEDHRSKIERTSTAIGRVLGCLGDHPAVASVGWDVMLCGFSLVIWAAVRGLDTNGILEGASLSRVGKAFSHDARNAVSQKLVDAKGKAKELVNDLVGESPTTLTKRGRGRPRKETNTAVLSSPRKSTRSTKAEPESDSDDVYTPDRSSRVDEQTQGEEDAEEDVEAGVLSWGLLSLGGLGVAGAGVLGAEVGSH